MKIDTTAIKEAIKKEAYYHDQWDEYNLVENILHATKKEASKMIDEFNHYDLPSSAEAGKSWNLPDWFIQGNNSPEAPYWSFAFCEFTAYIRTLFISFAFVIEKILQFLNYGFQSIYNLLEHSFLLKVQLYLLVLCLLL